MPTNTQLWLCSGPGAAQPLLPLLPITLTAGPRTSHGVTCHHTLSLEDK